MLAASRACSIVVEFDGRGDVARSLPQFAGVLGVLFIVPIIKSFAADHVGDRRDELRFVLHVVAMVR